MEWFGIGAGLLWTALVGYWIGYRSRKPEEWEGKALLREMQDIHDKMRLLYDRGRKRLETETPNSEPSVAPDSKAALRAEARAKGLIR